MNQISYLPEWKDFPKRCSVTLLLRYLGMLEEFKVIKQGKFWKTPRKDKFVNSNFGINSIAEIPKKLAIFIVQKLPLSESEISEFSGHSFRRTGATLAADSGLQNRQLQTLGGWKSTKVVDEYVDRSVMNLTSFTSKILGLDREKYSKTLLQSSSSENTVTRKTIAMFFFRTSFFFFFTQFLLS